MHPSEGNLNFVCMFVYAAMTKTGKRNFNVKICVFSSSVNYYLKVNEGSSSKAYGPMDSRNHPTVLVILYIVKEKECPHSFK